MNLYVVRHGETDHNKEHRYNCRIDEDINDVGIKQATELIGQLENIDIDLIVCSPMKRAKHTCDIVNIKKIPVIYDDRLMERIGGILTNTIIDDNYFYEEFYNYYSKDNVQGLEPLPILFKRIHSLLDEIKDKYSDKNILVITHGAVALAIQYYFEPIPSDGHLLKIGEQKNCEIKKYNM